MTITEKTQKELSERAIYLVLDWSALGTWKRVDTEKVVTKKQKRDDEVRARKRVINQVRWQTYAPSVTRSGDAPCLCIEFNVPPRCLRNTSQHVDYVDSILKDADSNMQVVREKLQAEWPSIIKDAKERLGDLFDSGDYPRQKKQQTN